MATLQKFKLLATQCGVAPSPTRSPRKSPLVQLRRHQKTTLRMLLTRSSGGGGGGGRRWSPRKRESHRDHQETIVVVADLAGKKGTLKDLFVSSSSSSSPPPPPPFEGEEKRIVRGKSEVIAMKLNGWGGEPGSSRPVWVGFRHRSLLRRAWRPMLITIPE